MERSEAVGSGDLLDDLEAGVPKVVDELYVKRIRISQAEIQKGSFSSVATCLLIARFLGLAAFVSRVIKVGPVRVLVVARFGRDCSPEDAELLKFSQERVPSAGKIF